MTEHPPNPPSGTRPRWIAPLILGTALFVALMIVTMALVNASRQTTTAPPSSGLPAVVEGEAYTGTLYDPPLVLQDFELPASTGDVVSLRDLDGRWKLLFFGYTHCPDFCPTTLLDFRQIKRALGEDAAEVAFIFISVDGERDTPEMLRRYLEPFDSEFIGLSGDDTTLTRIQPDYGLYYALRRNNAPPGRPDLYPVDHSTRSYLIDPQGRLRVSFAYNTGVTAIAERIRMYLDF